MSFMTPSVSSVKSVLTEAYSTVKKALPVAPLKATIRTALSLAIISSLNTYKEVMMTKQPPLPKTTLSKMVESVIAQSPLPPTP